VEVGKRGSFINIKWVGMLPDLMLISEKDARWLIIDREATIFGAMKN
jgi:hypothetical protein